MKHSAMYIISGIGALVLFVAFLFYTSAPVNLVGWFKLSDLLTIIGGLMFIIPFGAKCATTRRIRGRGSICR